MQSLEQKQADIIQRLENNIQHCKVRCFDRWECFDILIYLDGVGSYYRFTIRLKDLQQKTTHNLVNIILTEFKEQLIAYYINKELK